MRIAMVGPVYPFKGGIAQYTGAMSNNLLKENEVRVFSFSMLYPKALYKHEQRDYENKTFEFKKVDYLLNSVNPVSWYRTAAAINRYRPDAVIVQWWHPWFGPCYWTLLRHIKKNIKVIFLCHNVLPHEGFPMKRMLSRMVLRKGTGFIVHSELDEQDLRELVPSPHLIHTVIPTYNQFRKRFIDKATARGELDIPSDQEMLLFFGFIRKYKGLSHLIRALPTICAARPKAHLWVVGDFFENDKSDYEALIREVGCAERLTLVDGYLPDDKVEPYFAASDLCVLPYESATQSAVIQISYSFGCPVVATDVGGLPEVVLDGKTGFVVPALDDEALAKAVIRFFDEDKAAEFTEWIGKEAEKYSWDRMNEHIARLLSIL